MLNELEPLVANELISSELFSRRETVALLIFQALMTKGDGVQYALERSIAAADLFLEKFPVDG